MSLVLSFSLPDQTAKTSSRRGADQNKTASPLRERTAQRGEKSLESLGKRTDERRS